MLFQDSIHFAQPLSANFAVISLRTATIADIENLLNTMDSILSHSKVLLRSASAISRPLSRCEAPAEVLRLETDNTLLDTDIERSRQDLHALLEPCGLGKSFGDCYKGTIQARGRDVHGL